MGVWEWWDGRNAVISHCTLVVPVVLWKEIWTGLQTAGRSGEGTVVKEVRRISKLNYDFTKLKEIGFREKKQENMFLPLIKISK